MITTRQLEVLRALVDTLIPPDADPGGWDAGVGDYLLRGFGADLALSLPLYRIGLDALDAEAKAVHNAGFDALSPTTREALLKRVEGGEVTAVWVSDPRAFVRLAAEHCAEGFYSDPANGGNRGGAAWTMVGFKVTG